MKIDMDFVSDWEDILINKATMSGLHFPNNTSKDKIIVGYFTNTRKNGILRLTPRQIHISKEFACPPDLEVGLNQLISALENGEDISPYFSKSVNDISETDGMFNDWGVLHLHLGDKINPKDNHYSIRTNQLLFLYLLEKDAYLINIYAHGNWAAKSILQTVHNNWPELIVPYIVNGAIELSCKITDNENDSLRKKGVTCFIELVDKNGCPFVIVPPGLGITLSGDAILDRMRYNSEKKRIKELENYINSNPEYISEVIQLDNDSKIIRLKLISDNDKWYILEQSTGTKKELVNWYS